VFEFAGAAKGNPLDNLEISFGVHRQSMGCGKECGVSLVFRPVSLAVGLFAVPQIRCQLGVRVQYGYSTGHIRKIKIVLVLIKTTGISHRADEVALMVERQVEHLDADVLAVGTIDLRLAAVAGIEFAISRAARGGKFTPRHSSWKYVVAHIKESFDAQYSTGGPCVTQPSLEK